MAAITVVWLGFVALPAVHAQEPVSSSLPLTSIGLAEPLRFNGAYGRIEFSVIQQEGFRPVELKADLNLTGDITNGKLLLLNGDAVIDRLNLPAKEKSIRLSLDKAVSKGGMLPLAIAVSLGSSDRDCHAATDFSLELQNLVINFSGARNDATSLSDFWRGESGKLQLYLPPQPTEEEAEVALITAAVAARQYPSRPQEVSVEALSDGSPWPKLAPDSGTKGVIISSGQPPSGEPSAGSLPLLLINGPPQTLVPTVTALISNYKLEIPAPPPGHSGSITLAQLGMPSLRLGGVGEAELPLRISQMDLGEPAAITAFQLDGSIDALPAAQSAWLEIFLNGRRIYKEDLLKVGAFERRINLPAADQSRENILLMRLHYFPIDGLCSVDKRPLIFRLDGSSSLEFRREQVSLPGFERFPQTLQPEFDVALQPLTPESIAQAAGLIAAMQRTGKRLLIPHVIPLKEITQSSLPLLLVTTDAAAGQSLDPPLAFAGMRIVDRSGQEILRQEAGQPFAAMVAFEHKGRQILLLSAYQDPALMTRLVKELGQNPAGWYAAAGEAWIYPAQGFPMGIPLASAGITQQLLPERISSLDRWGRPALLVILFLVLTAVFMRAYPKIVRSPSKRKEEQFES